MNQYKFSQLPYEPNNFEALQQKINDLTSRIKEASLIEEVLEVIALYDQMQNEVIGNYMIAYIRSSLDYTDSFYAEAAKKEAMGCAQLEASAYHKALLDSPFLPALEEHFGPEYRLRLEKEWKTASAGQELMAREQELIASYQQKKAGLKIMFRGKEYSEGELYFFFTDPDRQTRIDCRKALAKTVLEKKEEFSSILLELITLRDGIAKANGFANYLEYANAIYYRSSYGEKELSAFCEQVKTHLVPFLDILREEQRKELKVDKIMSYDKGIYFADGNAVPIGDASLLTAAAGEMYNAFDPEFGDFFRGMVETESLDVTASPNKIAGMGFCTSLKKGLYPYIFGNCDGTQTDVAVFTHEIGHAWQSYLSEQTCKTRLLEEMALDVVEIPSKTMELFTYPYAEKFFGKDAEKYRFGHFKHALQEIAAYCEIHELNTWIYTHVGASFDELTGAARELALQYDPSLDYGELDIYNRQGVDLIRNMGIFMFPRYLISYALSEMCAMDLFVRMQKNPEQAKKAYHTLCSLGGSLSYPDTLAAAGLTPAYLEGSVKKVISFAKEYLKL